MIINNIKRFFWGHFDILIADNFNIKIVYNFGMNKINLTPIIDVVFILLIFFMLATNFQDFSQTEIDLSNESAKSISSDKKMYLIKFNKDKEFKLNEKKIHVNDIKAKILTSIRSKEEHLVVINPDDDVNMQIILSVMEDFNRSKIENILLGIKDKDGTKQIYEREDGSKAVKTPRILGKPVQ